MTKRCASCGRDRPLDEFSRRSRSRDGRDNYCRACKTAAQRRWREANQGRERITLAERRARAAGVPVEPFTLADWTAFRAMLSEALGIGDECLYCRDPRPATIDHVVALTRGGAHTLANCAPCCARCNSSKKDRDLAAWVASTTRPIHRAAAASEPEPEPVGQLALPL